MKFGVARFFNRLVLCFVFLLGVTVVRGDIEVTNLDSDGEGSLRRAIEDAVPGETITFDALLSGGTLRLDGVHLTVDKDLTIDASALNQPVTISGDNGNDGLSLDDSRIFYIAASEFDFHRKSSGRWGDLFS